MLMTIMMHETQPYSGFPVVFKILYSVNQRYTKHRQTPVSSIRAPLIDKMLLTAMEYMYLNATGI